MEMTIHERSDSISHVALAGRLDATGAEEIEEKFFAATSDRDQSSVIDLSRIEFMASRGIGLLFTTTKRLKKAGQKLVLLNPRGMVEVVLKTSNMHRVMPLVYDLDEAIHMLGGDPSSTGAASESLSDELGPTGDGSLVAASGTEVLEVTIENDLSELDTLNAAVADFLKANDVPSRAAYAIDLAIEELIVNVIRYAYMDDDAHFIEVKLAVGPEQIVLEIVDDGRPFDPRRGPALNVHAEDREVGGLGLILVLDLVDALKYERVDEKNCIEVRVHLVPEQPSDDSENELSEANDAAS